ncbi:hypothetical protein EVAR_38629_1 [Eumeta japonica]|uniref:Uncharacterized protein n=1 Tax=Eumeta variegata TaxID=151549 RepID=A0A4C1XZ12_EUMVA|nr:hypothetical protein EVAR_38629_1 [Eumeta japonica]
MRVEFNAKSLASACNCALSAHIVQKGYKVSPAGAAPARAAVPLFRSALIVRSSASAYLTSSRLEVPISLASLVQFRPRTAFFTSLTREILQSYLKIQKRYAKYEVRRWGASVSTDTTLARAFIGTVQGGVCGGGGRPEGHAIVHFFSGEGPRRARLSMALVTWNGFPL